MTQIKHPTQDALAFVEMRRSVARYVEDPLRKAVTTLGSPLQRMAEYHFGWVNADGTESDSRERILRRRAATMAFLAAGSDPKAWGRARNVAVVNTIMWGGIFVHDDLVDRDELRYGRATVWKAFGEPAAVHLGGALLALAFHALDDEPAQIQAEIRSRMASCVETVCGGQALEMQIEQARTSRLEEVLAVYARKTGAAGGYFFASGALSAGASADRVRAAAELGSTFGTAFQLKNDFENMWDNTRTGLEDALSDLRQRKVTAPVAYALHLPAGAGAELAEYYKANETPDARDLVRLRQLLERCGAQAWLKNEIAERTGAALRLVHDAAADPRAEGMLNAFVVTLCQGEVPAFAPDPPGKSL